MNQETMTYLFSHICGQVHSFEIDGVYLPLGQRCLGLYLGALMTMLWFAGSGLWRNGMPPRPVAILHGFLLVLLVPSGLHVIDPGALWRLAMGLFTGHLAVFWLLAATSDLRTVTQTEPAIETWTLPGKAQAIAFPAVLAVFALMFPVLLGAGWLFWTAVATTGVAVLFAILAVAVVIRARMIWHLFRTA